MKSADTTEHALAPRAAKPAKKPAKKVAKTHQDIHEMVVQRGNGPRPHSLEAAEPLIGRGGYGRGGRPSLGSFVCHLERLAEMRDRLLER
jgi:hypothetical protein